MSKIEDIIQNVCILSALFRLSIQTNKHTHTSPLCTLSWDCVHILISNGHDKHVKTYLFISPEINIHIKFKARKRIPKYPLQKLRKIVNAIQSKKNPEWSHAFDFVKTMSVIKFPAHHEFQTKTKTISDQTHFQFTLAYTQRPLLFLVEYTLTTHITISCTFSSTFLMSMWIETQTTLIPIHTRIIVPVHFVLVFSFSFLSLMQ